MIVISTERTNGLSPAKVIDAQGGLPAPRLPQPPLNGRPVQSLDFRPRVKRIMAAIALSRQPAK